MSLLVVLEALILRFEFYVFLQPMKDVASCPIQASYRFN